MQLKKYKNTKKIEYEQKYKNISAKDCRSERINYFRHKYKK